MEEEANHLFKNDLHLLIDLDKGSVAHEEGTQRLYQGDLQWKVERGDHRHSTKGPSVSTGLLAGMVSRKSERASQIAYIISREGRKPLSTRYHFPFALCPGFADGALDQPREEIFDLLVTEQHRQTMTYLTQHDVPFRVVQGVVKAVFRTAPQPFDKGSDFIQLRVRNHQKLLAIEWIDDIHGALGVLPLSPNEVLSIGRI
mmetsp:Transcript_28038/g.54522  ORF Transcript_28038/g.54522 Transcript_28038/m.54522 type:complete len:201 (-) Transcript_28038:176-778(-)